MKKQFSALMSVLVAVSLFWGTTVSTLAAPRSGANGMQVYFYNEASHVTFTPISEGVDEGIEGGTQTFWAKGETLDFKLTPDDGYQEKKMTYSSLTYKAVADTKAIDEPVFESSVTYQTGDDTTSIRGVWCYTAAKDTVVYTIPLKYLTTDGTVIKANTEALSYTIQLNMANGSVVAKNEDGEKITTATAGQKVYLDVTLSQPSKVVTDIDVYKQGAESIKYVTATPESDFRFSFEMPAYNVSFKAIIEDGPTSIKLNHSQYIVPVDRSFELISMVSTTGINHDVIWTSSNTDVAAVNPGVSSGVYVFAGKKPGTATITATTRNGKTATCAVTVRSFDNKAHTLSIAESNDYTIAGVKIGGVVQSPPYQVKYGQQLELQVKLTESAIAANKIFYGASLRVTSPETNTWDNEFVAWNYNISNGVVTFFVNYDRDMTLTVNTQVKRYQITCDSEEFGVYPYEAARGEKVSLSFYKQVTNSDKVITHVWICEQKGGKQINQEVGLTGKDEGPYSFTMPDHDIYVQLETGQAVQSVTLDKETEEIALGGTLSLTASVLPKDAAYPDVIWQSANPSIASVEAGKGNVGIVTGNAGGQTTITAFTKNGKIAECVITVVEDFETAVRYEVLTKDGEGCTVKADRSQVVKGGAVSYTVTPKSGYRITSILLNEKETVLDPAPALGKAYKGTVKNVESNLTVSAKARFVREINPDQKYTLTIPNKNRLASLDVDGVEQLQSGGGVWDGSWEVEPGSEITVILNTSYSGFDGWNPIGFSMSAVDCAKRKTTFRMPANDATLDMYYLSGGAASVTFAIQGEGTVTVGKSAITKEARYILNKKGDKLTFKPTQAAGYQKAKVTISARDKKLNWAPNHKGEYTYTNQTGGKVVISVTFLKEGAKELGTLPKAAKDIADQVTQMDAEIGTLQNDVINALDSNGKIEDKNVIAQVNGVAEKAKEVLSGIKALAESVSGESAELVAESVAAMQDTLRNLDAMLYACPGINKPEVSTGDEKLSMEVTGLGLTASEHSDEIVELDITAGKDNSYSMNLTVEDKKIELESPVVFSVPVALDGVENYKWMDHIADDGKTQLASVPATFEGATAVFMAPSFSSFKPATNAYRPDGGTNTNTSRGGSRGDRTNGFDGYWMTATAGKNGTIFPAGATKLKFGDDLTYTVTPAPGYVVDQVLLDGKKELTLINNTYTIQNANEPYSIHATFKKADGTQGGTTAGSISQVVPVAVNPATGDSNDRLVALMAVLLSAAVLLPSGFLMRKKRNLRLRHIDKV